MKTNLHFVFYANASKEIGAGHFMRSLALAEECLNESIRVSFACVLCPEYLQQDLQTRGITYIALTHNFTRSDLNAFQADVIFIDDYNVSQNQWHDFVETGAFLVAIDDNVSAQALLANMVVNAAAGNNDAIYKRRAPGAYLCLGPAFTLLRKEFKQSFEANDKTEKVDTVNIANRDTLLITLGGADVKNMSLVLCQALLLKMLKQFPTIKICVLLGGLNNAALPSLQQLAATHSQLTLIEQSNNMAVLMASAGLAISAAGGTLSELGAMGTPVIGLVSVDNQQAALVSPYIGRYFEVIDVRAFSNSNLQSQQQLNTAIIDEITAKTAELWLDICRRQSMSQAGRQIIDGKGCQRIIDKVLALLPPKNKLS